MKSDRIKEDLVLLCVDDDEMLCKLLAMRLGRVFRKVRTSSDPHEALSILRNEHVDILITDYMMPEMNGLDLTREAKALNARMPVIMLTGYVDMDFLIATINVGVNHFLAKPVNMQALERALDDAIQSHVAETLRQRTREQELELLRYKEKYHSTQEEMAFSKELHIIRNDLLCRMLRVATPDGEQADWLSNVYYRPLDTMCGDSYSLRNLGDGRLLYIFIDAMGKGLSASVTSMISTSYLNHQVDIQLQEERYCMEDLITSYLPFVRKNMLDEEIVCILFLEIDLATDSIRYVSFSCPTILAEGADGFHELKSQALPVMKYEMPYTVAEVQIPGLKRVMVYSDGLSESTADKGHMYGEYLADDFRQSPFAPVMHRRVESKIQSPEDDLTLFFLKKWSPKTEWKHRSAVSSTRAGFKLLEEEWSDKLADHVEGEADREALLFALSTALLRCMESGCFGISKRMRNNLRKTGEYIQAIAACEQEKAIMLAVEGGIVKEGGVTVFYWRVSGADMGVTQEELLLLFRKHDTATEGYLSALSAGGDDIYFSVQGDELFLMKEISMKMREDGGV